MISFFALVVCVLWPLEGYASSPEKSPPGTLAFKPKSFEPKELATLALLTETILPSQEKHPGAREAKVAEFIDFQTEYDSELKNRFRSGLKWMNAHLKNRYGKDFEHLTLAQRSEFLDGLAYKSMYREGEEPGREFYRLLKRYTEMGFYTSKVGLESLSVTELPKSPSLRKKSR